MTRRTRRSVAGSVLVVLGLVIGAVIVTALQAEGRERSKADTNDGGAWLLKRDAGYVGHVNRAGRRGDGRRQRRRPGLRLRRRPGAGIIVVHDRTTGVGDRRRRHASSASPTRPASASARTSPSTPSRAGR